MCVHLKGGEKMTWSCPRCRRPFLTEQQMLIHYLSCGSSYRDARLDCFYIFF